MATAKGTRARKSAAATAPPTDAPTTGAHRRGTRRPRRARQGRHVARQRPGAQAHQPRQAPVPARQADGGSPITKRELIRYFARIAPAMLPHLAERPLNLQRFPNGAGAPGFWQKDIPETAPKWLRRWRETGVDGRTDRSANEHLIADRVATLCWLGNQASFEIHAWTGQLPEAWSPTFAYIDIDPGEKTTWDETLVLARLYRTALGHLGVRGYPKTTGKRGIQIWIPIVPKYSFEETSNWVERISKAVGSTVPDLVSWEWATKARQGRARLDYTQNASIKTLVAPYAVRPAAARPSRPRSPGTSWTTRTCDRTAGRSGPSSSESRSRRPVRGRPDRCPGAPEV